MPKDPASFKNKTLEDSTRNALNLRYEILPYIYTTMYHVNQMGGTAIKALFFELDIFKFNSKKEKIRKNKLNFKVSCW